MFSDLCTLIDNSEITESVLVSSFPALRSKKPFKKGRLANPSPIIEITTNYVSPSLFSHGLQEIIFED